MTGNNLPEIYQQTLVNEHNKLFASFQTLNDSTSVSAWIIRRIRGMFYLSNPAEVNDFSNFPLIMINVIFKKLKIII